MAAAFGHLSGESGEIFLGGLQRHMRTVIRQIEEERLVVVALEERERGGSLRFQPIPGLFNDGAVRV